jgi:hypothetical protein
VPSKNTRKVEAELRRRREKFYAIGHIESASGAAKVVYNGKLPLT